MTEYIGQKKPLGGLLLLLPQIFSSENKDSVEGDHNSGKELIRNLLVELERLLIHANIRVSGISIFLIFCIHMILIAIIKPSVCACVSLCFYLHCLPPEGAQ